MARSRSRLRDFFKKLSRGEKIGIVSSVIIPIALFVFSEVRNHFKELKIGQLQYQMGSMQFRPRLTSLGDPVFQNIVTEPIQMKTTEYLDLKPTSPGGDTLNLGKLTIKRIESQLRITNSGNALAKIVGVATTSKHTDGDLLRSIIVEAKQDEATSKSISFFPMMFQDEILNSPQDTISLDLSHEIFSRDLSKDKQGILHYLILYENEMGHFFDTYFWLEISLQKIVVPNPFWGNNRQLLPKTVTFKLPVRDVVVMGHSKPSYHTYSFEEERKIRANFKKIVEESENANEPTP
jgi:hypothetical protein